MKIADVYRGLYELAIEQDWEISFSGTNHLKWQPPAGRPVFTAGTPGDRREYLNTRAKLRRAGLKV